MTRDEKTLLDRATQALRADVPDAEAIRAAAERTAQALEIRMDREAFEGAIENCAGVQRLFVAHRAGNLTENRRVLVDAHLRDCGECLRLFKQGREGAVLNWSAPAVKAAPKMRPARLGWAMATAAAALVTSVFVYRVYWQVPPGVRAEVQSIDGTAFVMGEGGDRKVAAGAELREGDELRTTGGSRAVLRLSDGSLVEVNQRSALGVGARGHNMTVSLDRGAVIVQAAHRTSGHLYLKTPDCRVAVTGTVFSVDAGIKGSRVGVLQGSVNVAYAGMHTMLHPGEQVATSDNLAPEPLDQQFAWSPEREKYVGMLAQLANVEHQIAQIPFPGPRYSSDLLTRVPMDTQLYVSIPNLGEFLQQANTIFQNQLNASPELKAWWTQGHKQNPDELNQLVTKIHDVSQYLGNEVVLIGTGTGESKTVALLADVTKSGLKDELQQIAGDGNKLTVLDPNALAAADASQNAGKGMYALVRDHEVVFAHDIATLKKLSAQLDAGASGFADGEFGKQMTAAYTRGAGILLGANLQAMLQNAQQTAAVSSKRRGLESTGLSNVQYLIAEHRELNGAPANHLNLQFTGTRQRVASWLASPGPIGSLDFVSPNAAAAVATLTKDPAAIADDLMAMATQAKGQPVDWNEIDQKLQIDVRNDLMANLGGDFTLALDGPVLPTPSWKMVIEVNNASALENTLEKMVQAISSQAQGTKAHVLQIQQSTVDSTVYYTVRDVTAGAVVAEYTYANGFMVMGPNRAIVMDALKTQANGNSLSRSASFRASLPKDENENYSAVAYQNLSPVLTPLLSQLTGDTAQAIQKLAADARPTVICAWGQDNRIEAASDSRLFGFDFLTLGAILHSGNKPPAQNVLN
ncbi:FecR domain-containing protein [Occallatibacter riparius]|uniref:FecR domain-containing protein n=1 Tax=Occallatibacter riparius TaxID=1002689 RepID=A0A9J7BS52_9BACT|nr:FecR domain-containing protein [Occallatibacter riparius]UWZ85407.1 FecR domain-containing protein [Occallatibacter riparius]